MKPLVWDGVCLEENRLAERRKLETSKLPTTRLKTSEAVVAHVGR